MDKWCKYIGSEFKREKKTKCEEPFEVRKTNNERKRIDT